MTGCKSGTQPVGQAELRDFHLAFQFSTLLISLVHPEARLLGRSPAHSDRIVVLSNRHQQDGADCAVLAYIRVRTRKDNN